MFAEYHKKNKINRNKNYLFGHKAEELVIEHLKKIGFEILHHRWKNPYGEIDIIATSKNLLIFVEVKGRKNFFSEEIISKRQKNRISEAALYFLSNNQRFSNYDIRFDCAFVSDEYHLEYIENAWYASF